VLPKNHLARQKSTTTDLASRLLHIGSPICFLFFVSLYMIEKGVFRRYGRLLSSNYTGKKFFLVEIFALPHSPVKSARRELLRKNTLFCPFTPGKFFQAEISSGLVWSSRAILDIFSNPQSNASIIFIMIPRMSLSSLFASIVFFVCAIVDCRVGCACKIFSGGNLLWPSPSYA
jgi:hypothetical protein